MTYRPLFLLWLRVNAALFRIHPAGWHLATLAAHVAATYFVFLLARKVFAELARGNVLRFGVRSSSGPHRGCRMDFRRA